MANKTELHASDQTSPPNEEPAKTTGCQAAAAVGRRAQRGKRRGPADKRRGPADKRRGPADKRRGSADKRRCSADKRRGSADKRRGPADKRRGSTDTRRGRRDKKRGQEEVKEGVTVKRTWNDGKRRWDKKHYCVFCRRPQVKIARHLLMKHADQQEVAAASTLPAGSKQRHLLLEHLRCRGNFMHNIEVIRQGTGEIIPWRQPSEDVDARNYLPCPLCLGFFRGADLWKHQVSCRKKLSSDPSKDSASSAETTSDPMKDSTSDPTKDSTSCDPAYDRTDKSTEDTPADPSGAKRPLNSDPNMDQNVTPDSGADQPRKRNRVQAAASRLLPISSGASESCSEVLYRMNQDNVSHQVKSDWLICKYGNKLMGNQDGSQRRRYDYVSQKLRELGRFLLAAKSLDSSIQTLQDVLAPGRLSLALAAARKASGYRWSRPPLALKTTLRTVCEIAIGESLQDGDWEAAAKTTDFYHLLGREWDNLGLRNQTPNTAAPAEGANPKNRSIESRIPSQSSNQPVTSMISPKPRLQTPVTVPVAPGKVQRRPWSTAEKEAVWRHLGVHVLSQSVPGKEVCQRCLDLEPALRGRHWKDIKNQVYNQIQSQKKQQFHAQMDLQENQEQQDQIQNQKKKQQQYQAQMSQRGKEHTLHQKKQQYQAQMDHQDQDNIQNKKKQQYHIQVDHQDQDSIQNTKKQQYHSQVEHQDHLEIHKKQLCHARLDHQDHIQMHKKQLYQMGEQTQGLQTTLDRDTSILTGSSYGPDGTHPAPGQSLLERDPSISQYPLPHRTLGPHMEQLLSRTEWTDESLAQHYSISRQLDQNLLQDGPSGQPPNPHSGHVHF